MEFYNNPYCNSEYDDGKTFVTPNQRFPIEGKDTFDSNILLSIEDEEQACNRRTSSCSKHAFDMDLQTVIILNINANNFFLFGSSFY